MLKGILSLLAVTCGLFAVTAQSLNRPVIWAGDADRNEMLNRIDTYTWASSVKSQAQSIVDAKVTTHLTNPSAILDMIPAFAADDNLSEADASAANSGHAEVTYLASYSAMLYYITQEEKYAQFSADIVSYYIDAMVDVDVDKMAASGNYFYDSRTTYAHFAIAYDFIYDFLTTQGTKVYVESSGQSVDFDNVKAQRMIKKLASNALQEHSGADTHGKTVSNHPILTAPGVLFCIMCVDDDTERERLFNVFWNAGTKKQNSFKNTILPMFGEQGIWPESLSYGFMPGITMVLNTIDRFKPEMNVMADYKYILDGNFLFDYLRLPNRYFVRYGDSKRKIDQTGTLYRYALDIASRRNYTDIEAQAKVALRQSYDASGGYSPIVSTSTFNACSAFPHLFWGVDVPAQVESSIDFNKPTVIIKHAGVALQRNHSNTDNKQYGLCGIIGGAHYVHSHVTGIAMELYGQGYVMGPNAGLCATLAERSEPEHTDYFRLYAGNNTVIVNGTSHGIQDGAWNSDSYLWMNTTVNTAAEPKHLEDPISDKFSFAMQFLDDNVNNCDQQRTLSTIRTSATTAYYFDMFRSKSLDENLFHDYVYHNIGDEMHINDGNNIAIPVTATTKYQTNYSDPVESPGWKFFEDTKTTASTDVAVNVRFDINEGGKYMHMFTPAGVAREFTKAMGPASREGEDSYLDKNTPILAVRQQGEAWKNAFVHIFEPAGSTVSSVKSVEHLYHGGLIVGVKVSSQIGDKTVDDYILCQPFASRSLTLPQYDISFTGRFAIVRYEQDANDALTTLYIGEGQTLTYGDITLTPAADNKGIKEVAGEPYFGRQLEFKDVSNADVIPSGSNLSVEAVVGDDFVEATLWVNGVSMGVKTEAPYVWSGQAMLTNMTSPSYTLRLVAKDVSDGVVEKTVTISTEAESPNTFSGEGLYTFYNADKTKWMGYDIATNDALVTAGGDAENNIFNVVANGDKFNVYTGDNQKVVIINSASGYTAMLATPTASLLASGDALFSFNETAPESELYLLTSGAIDAVSSNPYNLNVKSTGLDIGRGTTAGSNYQWQITRINNVVTSIKETIAPKTIVNVYPNPAQHQLTIIGAEIVNAEIFSLSGCLMKSAVVSNAQLDVSSLASGLYILKMKGVKGESYMSRFVKQ